jgi:hypothetical protein
VPVEGLLGLSHFIVRVTQSCNFQRILGRTPNDNTSTPKREIPINVYTRVYLSSSGQMNVMTLYKCWKIVK